MSTAAKVIKMRSTKSLCTGGLSEYQIKVREEIRVTILNFLHAIVVEPQGVDITFKQGDRTVQYIIDCPKREIGRLIGTKGKMIGAIRVIVAAMAAKADMRAIVEIPYYDPNGY